MLLLIHWHEASTLFYSGSTHSFVPLTFAAKLEHFPSALTHALVVSIPTGEHICTRAIFYDCMLEIGQARILVNLMVLLRMDDFDVII